MLAAAVFALVAASARPPEAPPVRLALSPAVAPAPALKYRLLPPVSDLAPGNPVQWYLRCFAEQRNFFYGPESVEKRVRYRGAPLAELAKDDLREYGGGALKQADYGARLDVPDWEALRRVRDEGVALRQPELDALRLLADGLHVRLRGQTARDDFAAATYTAQTMFALARHLGEHPTSEGNRLGLVTAGFALDGLEELIARPGSPNLYWALTDLPCPLVDIRKGTQGDRAGAAVEFRGLRDDAAMTAAEVEGVVSRLSGRLGLARERDGLPPRGLRPELAKLVADPARVKTARGRMFAERGWKFGLQFLPPEQVILLDERARFEARCDDADKLLNLMLVDADALARAEAPAGGLFADLVPRPLDTRREQVGVDQRVALLRHVEALRIGSTVPVPSDPVTGKPFAVGKDGDAVTLRAAATHPGRAGRRYEVTLQTAQPRGKS